MDAKVSLPSLNKPSGTSLLILLAVLLFLLAIAFAQVTGQFPAGSFKMLFPLGICAALAAALGYAIVPLLRSLKAGQIIQEDGPQTHLKKAGTPTMGGIFFVPVAVVVAVVWSGFNREAIAVSCVTLAHLAIGWYDDWQILRQRSNKGISPRMKLTLQISIAVLFCLWALWTQPATITNLVFPGNLILPLGLLFWPLAGFSMVAESNATNLTDGVDGLAAGTSAVAFLGLAALAAPTSIALAIFCVCMSGGCLGFVVHNHNPAKVFMGDTGSLALGGALAAVAILTNNLWGLLIVSGIFLLESLSVIAQVSYYKATKGPDGKGKRLLKMAPIHHHLELSGWSETQIVGAFYLINAGLSLLAVFIA
ncbi:phospho-N-acetylmuramoyl-pentapeptide-transferase [Candidatus Gracilibacteria bacterium]|nr:phospho-N-acetylmuramoyl-pentapeptide-transferase [Candidatus Gracilibacteria bacterium]NJM89029.1 phospho-N-acetylmuramoyl-pentapeptide-transferase [Hydrococcus sp. RU_2_2]NJP21011.1 phospho-N-acetylmuramoyl-pentapeptide-transferase [Hydrococcus sp. CRU_1_1]